MDNRIAALIKLLDDSDPQNVHTAMSELLKHGAALEPYLAEHHESENPALRRRIHQLQSIITLRRRRADFLRIINNPETSLAEGLMEVHLQWYDNDSRRSLEDQWQDFMETADRYHPNDLAGIAYFMRKTGFTVPPVSDIHADHYCLGPVLEDHSGADFMLAAVAVAAGAELELDLKVVKLLDNFIIVDNAGNALAPRNNWQLQPRINIAQCEFWNNSKILKFASLMLFQYAVCSDSFRYISTIGHSLTGLGDEDPLDFLPYPYRPESGDNI
jgi:hypothetical protein